MPFNRTCGYCERTVYYVIVDSRGKDYDNESLTHIHKCKH
jgi:hypothetical protein